MLTTNKTTITTNIYVYITEQKYETITNKQLITKTKTKATLAKQKQKKQTSKHKTQQKTTNKTCRKQHENTKQ